jgi:hypothetical protein
MSFSVYPFLANKNFPKCFANANAASLPDGSIIPYINCSAVKTSLYLSSADVPLMFDEIEQTRILISSSLSLYCLLNSRTVYAVIIFVREATSLLTYSRLPWMKDYLLLSKTAQYLAETLGTFLKRMVGFA